MIISPPIQLGTIGMDDTLVLMVLALVLLGPRRLPQVGRQIGKLMYEFRKASNDFKYQLEEELRNSEEAERRKREEAERQLAVAQKAVVEAQSAAEQALQAAQQAQSAAQAAQTAAAESAPVPDSNSAASAGSAVPDPAVPDPAVPDMIYTFGSEPATVTGETQPAPAEPAETGLRIQPPTTGEQVARPGRAVPEPAADTAAAPVEESSLKKEVAAEEPPAATEPTTHHG